MDEKIKILIQKLYQGKCSREELDYLQTYLTSEKNGDLDKLFWEDWQKSEEELNDLQRKEEIFKKVQAQLSAKERSSFGRKRRSFSTAGFLKYAAVFVGLALISVFVYQKLSVKRSRPNQITIELEDGTIKTLDTGRIQLSDNTTINLKDGDKVTYETAENSEKLEYNTLRIPYGKKLQIVLSDGSLVYLNAGSSLKYPVKFIEGKGREVFLEGEAYFEVAHNTEEKFVVRTPDFRTAVYGTKFNISAYPEDELSRVTLVSGKIGVKAEGEARAELILKPDEMAVYSDQLAGLEVQEVNAQDEIAWVEGILVFKNQQFNRIIPSLERRYNIEIENKYKSLSDKKFTGRFRSEAESLEDVLRTFSKATPFSFRKLDGKIIIREK